MVSTLNEKDWSPRNTEQETLSLQGRHKAAVLPDCPGTPLQVRPCR